MCFKTMLTSRLYFHHSFEVNFGNIKTTTAYSENYARPEAWPTGFHHSEFSRKLLAGFVPYKT